MLEGSYVLKEKVSLQLRAEFVNIFNRMQLGNPSTTAPGTLPNKNPQGHGGFGTINLTVSGRQAAPTTTQNLCGRTTLSASAHGDADSASNLLSNIVKRN